MSSTIKILHLVDTLGMGGAETWLMELLRNRTAAADGSSLETHFLITSGERGVFDEEARQLGATIYYLPFRRRSLAAFVIGFRAILRRERYHAIHDHQNFVSGWHFLAGWGALPKVRITHTHNPLDHTDHNYGTTLARRLTTALGRRLVGSLASIAAGTSYHNLQANGFFQPPLAHLSKAVVPCGFRLQRFDGDVDAANRMLCQEFGWPERTPIVLFAGRLDASVDLDHPRNSKNSAFAVSVFARCLQEVAHAKMIMAGAKDHVQDRFLDYLHTLGLAESVVLTGIRKDIEKLMLGSNVLLFPSRAEGLGMVAVEAQAAGLPVIASRGVPTECVVLSELVTFEELGAPLDRWAAHLSDALRRPRPKPTVQDSRWAESSYDIRINAANLAELYRTGNVARRRIPSFEAV